MTLMGATQKRDGASEKADGYRLRVAVFDDLMARRGVNTVEAQAEAAGVHRSTMFRWRSGENAPSIGEAMNLARLAGTTVEKLFEQTDKQAA